MIQIKTINSLVCDVCDTMHSCLLITVCDVPRLDVIGYCQPVPGSSHYELLVCLMCGFACCVLVHFRQVHSAHVNSNYRMT